MQRFWSETGVREAGGEGFHVTLDGKPLALPGEGRLRVPARLLAEAIAAEWSRVGETFEPRELPLTQLAATAYHRIAPNPAPTIEALARYAESELLCYRAERPESLIRRQAESWQPWLAWAERRFDAPLRVTQGLGFIPQPAASLAALRAAVAAFDAAGLAALGVIVPALGSLVLGLAVMERALGAAEAQRLAELDALYQEERWGTDSLAEARRAHILGEIETAYRFFALTRTPLSSAEIPS
jgi:chaperone required for assembly of F1-ATPase